MATIELKLFVDPESERHEPHWETLDCLTTDHRNIKYMTKLIIVILVYFLPLSDIQPKNITETKRQQWHSTETSLISATDFILRTIDQKKITAVVYLDMSKAFDSINHLILFTKTGEHRSISLCTPMVRKLSFSEIPSSPYKLCFI